MSTKKKAEGGPRFWFLEPFPDYLNFWLFKANRITGLGEYSSYQKDPAGVTVRIMTGGQWTVKMCGRTRKAFTGDMFCAYPLEVIHFMQTEEESWGWYELQFSGPAAEEIMGELGVNRKTLVATPKNPQEAIRIFRRIYNYIEDEKRTVSGILAMLFDLIAVCGIPSEKTESSKNNSRDILVAKAVDILENIPDMNKNITELAEDLGVDRTTLYRAFKSKMGKTPHEYIDWLKNRRAEELLADTNMPVSQIAKRTGFADSKYFISWFKDKHGLPPDKWRNSR